MKESVQLSTVHELAKKIVWLDGMDVKIADTILKRLQDTWGDALAPITDPADDGCSESIHARIFSSRRNGET